MLSHRSVRWSLDVRGQRVRSFVCFHTVVRYTLNRLAMYITLSPFTRAVRIASTSLSVSGFRARLVGLDTAPGASSGTVGGPLLTPHLARSHAELSRSKRRGRSVWVQPGPQRYEPPDSAATAQIRGSSVSARCPQLPCLSALGEMRPECLKSRGITRPGI